MSELQWTIAVVGAFVLLTAVVWRRALKDMRGAILLAVLVIIVFGLFLSVSGCTVTEARRPWLEAQLAYDFERNVGGNPACVVGVRAPVGPHGREDWVQLAITHHSSCPDQDDRAEVNQAGVVVKIPLGRVKR